MKRLLLHPTQLGFIRDRVFFRFNLVPFRIYCQTERLISSIEERVTVLSSLIPTLTLRSICSPLYENTASFM